MTAGAADAPRIGLTSAQAAERLRIDGPNALPEPDRRSFRRILFDTLREPMFALLLGAGLIYLVLGEPADAILLLAFASLSVSIAVVQEVRSEKVLERLRDLSSPFAAVYRDGIRVRIPARELVRGDVVVLGEGDRIPADAVLLEARDIQTDESLLTGEATPVDKIAAPAAALVRAGAEHSASVYAGSLLVRGDGLGRVEAIGAHTEIGRIGAALNAIAPESPRLVREVRRLVRTVGAAALLLCATVVLVFGIGRGLWLEGLLGGIALGMAMIPEEFPLVLTVFTVMGAWRISRAGVLTRRATAIEALGAATVLCADKTGTLTQNRMTITEGWRDGVALHAGEAELTGLARLGALASAANPFDPMERAFHEAAGDPAPSGGLRLEKAFGLRPDLLAVTHVWAAAKGAPRLVAAKGAPEALAELCRLKGAPRQAMLDATEAMARRGMRVLAIADAEAPPGDLPASPRGFDLRFRGLVGLADPLRPDAGEAVRECRQAGIKVVMVTGDYPTTAQAIAQQAGLEPGDMLTGQELATLTDEALARRIGSVRVFARILPEQKLRIVRALQNAGEVVAMSGDGVNDAPALRAADIGVAMGARGADVAREAASLVLLQDGFGSIVHAIRLGRRIFDNLQKAMAFILAVHVPIGGLALFPLVTGSALILSPVHIAFLEMFIDPVCSVLFEAEPEAAAVMKRPPRPASERLISPRRLAASLGRGVAALAAVLIAYFIAVERGLGLDAARTASFITLVTANIGLVVASRADRGGLFASLRRPNRWFWPLTVGIVAVLAGLVAMPLTRTLFRFAALDLGTIAVAVGLGAAPTVLGEAVYRTRVLLAALLRTPG
ncbi:MAG: cation-translocating P-type ATPase [Proteobacteria bacterium]|nr:cation-translocating P-type ATPase [Pseudomonadota bacterium]